MQTIEHTYQADNTGILLNRELIFTAGGNAGSNTDPYAAYPAGVIGRFD